MKQLGARPGYRVTSSGCINMSGPEIMPRVRVRAALPQEATPELLAQLEKDRSKQELVARAGGKPVAAVDEVTAKFPATWRNVTFEGTPISDVQDGDCELMEQLIRNVLKPMGVREIAGSNLNCVPHQVPINAVNVKLQVLSAPQGDAAPSPRWPSRAEAQSASIGRPPERFGTATGGASRSMRCAVSVPPHTQPVSSASTPPSSR